MILAIQLIIACSLVIYGGIRLTEKGDQLEDVVGISRGIVGTILLAAITSLPEFVATFSSIYYLNAPQLALGNIFGSNTFNLAILAILDLFFIREILYSKAPRAVVKALSVSLILAVLALTGIILNSEAYTIEIAISGKPILIASWFSLALLIVHIFTLKETSETDESDTESNENDDENEVPHAITRSRLITEFCFYAVIVVISGIWLTNVCDNIADVTGIGKTFVGSILLAFATSLPEATVCTVAAKLGAFHLVFGNIFGSNIFNLFILGFADLSTPRMALLTVPDVQLNLITGMGSLFMSGLVLYAIFSKVGKKGSRFISTTLFAVYIVTFYIMFIQQQAIQ